MRLLVTEDVDETDQVVGALLEGPSVEQETLELPAAKERGSRLGLYSQLMLA